jgi:predicted DNA-binding transcriptional regulator AlpA
LEPEIMLAEEVAALMRMSLPHFYNLRHQGLGPPAVRIDGRLKFRRSDVDDYIASRVEEPADDRAPAPVRRQ